MLEVHLTYNLPHHRTLASSFHKVTMKMENDQDDDILDEIIIFIIIIIIITIIIIIIINCYQYNCNQQCIINKVVYN